MPDVSVRLKAGGKTRSEEFSPAAGGAIEIRFKPAKAKVSLDYSKENSLVLAVEGEFSLKEAGAGLPLSLSGSGSIALDGSKRMNGAVEWEISKNVEAKAEVKYSGSNTSAMATLTIRF